MQGIRGAALNLSMYSGQSRNAGDGPPKASAYACTGDFTTFSTTQPVQVYCIQVQMLCILPACHPSMNLLLHSVNHTTSVLQVCQCKQSLPAALQKSASGSRSKNSPTPQLAAVRRQKTGKATPAPRHKRPRRSGPPSATIAAGTREDGGPASPGLGTAAIRFSPTSSTSGAPPRLLTAYLYVTGKASTGARTCMPPTG